LREHPPAPGANPEEWFHREWVRTLFALTLDDLRAEACAARKANPVPNVRALHVDPDETGSYRPWRPNSAYR